MHTHRKLIILSCFVTLAASFAIAEVAEAGPIGGGVAPSEVEQTEQSKSKTNKTPGRGGTRGGTARLVAGPGTTPAAGVMAALPDHSVALTPKGKKPIPAHLDPGEIFSMSVGGGTEVADGIKAGVSAKGWLVTTGSLFSNAVQINRHVGEGNPDHKVELVLLPENPTQSYDFEVEVSKGTYKIAVDAYWVNDTTGGYVHDHDEVMATGELRSLEDKVRVSIHPDPAWPTPPTAYYVLVWNDVSDWTLRGATIKRGV